MKYKGMFYFDKKSHPGECEIDDNNNIYLTIYESDINEYKNKIVGNAGNESLDLYNCYLVDNGIGYYKYRIDYIVKNSINIKYRNVDFSKHIQDFRFTFKRLDEWLGFKTIVQDDKCIAFNIPNDIMLYNDDILKIEIKYFKEDATFTETSIKNMKIIPYICIKSTKVISIDKMMLYIQMITRFFATLMGYSSQVNNIKFHKMYNGKKILGDIEDEIIINTDFSNCYDISLGYSTYNLRTYYKNIVDDIQVMFNKWYDLYFNKKYEEALIFYFSPYSGSTIQDSFLTIMKCLEKLSIAKDNKKEKLKRSKQLHNLLKKFYDKYKVELEKSMHNNDFKKEYVRNIDRIHEDIANSIVYRYDNRVTLSNRIKDLDVNNILKKRFCFKHCTKENTNYNVYDYLANTRNYYTHLDIGEYIIKDDYMPGYIRILEKIFIKNLLSMIMDNQDNINEILNKDRYLSIYDNRDL